MIFNTTREDPCLTVNQDVSKPTPVLVVAVDDERNIGVLTNVFDPLQLVHRGALWLFVDGRIKTFAIEDEADGNDMGLAQAIHRREMGDTRRANKAHVFAGQLTSHPPHPPG